MISKSTPPPGLTVVFSKARPGQLHTIELLLHSQYPHAYATHHFLAIKLSTQRLVRRFSRPGHSRIPIYPLCATTPSAGQQSEWGILYTPGTAPEMDERMSANSTEFFFTSQSVCS